MTETKTRHFLYIFISFQLVCLLNLIDKVHLKTEFAKSFEDKTVEPNEEATCQEKLKQEGKAKCKHNMSS